MMIDDDDDVVVVVLVSCGQRNNDGGYPKGRRVTSGSGHSIESPSKKAEGKRQCVLMPSIQSDAALESDAGPRE